MNSKIKGSFYLIYAVLFPHRFVVKYRDGILQDIDRPLNPKTRKVGDSHSSPARDSKANFYSPNKNDYDEPDQSVEDSFQQQVRATKTNGGLSESLSKLKG